MVTSPYFLMNTTPRHLLDLYFNMIRRSPIPVGFYDRGRHATHVVESDLLPELLDEPNLQPLKNSSLAADRREIFLRAARLHANLSVLYGDKFDCVTPLAADCDGVLLGGGIFNVRLAAGIVSRP